MLWFGLFWWGIGGCERCNLYEKVKGHIGFLDEVLNDANDPFLVCFDPEYDPSDETHGALQDYYYGDC